MRRIFPLVWLLLLSSCLAFLMWFLWIYPGSGNANFFYFQTLIFVFCNAFVVIEAIGAVRRLKAAREAAAVSAQLR
jgi:phosphatidylinositol glycan class U